MALTHIPAAEIKLSVNISAEEEWSYSEEEERVSVSVYREEEREEEEEVEVTEYEGKQPKGLEMIWILNVFIHRLLVTLEKNNTESVIIYWPH